MKIISDLLLMGVGGGGCALSQTITAKANVAIKVLGVDTDAMSSHANEIEGLNFLLIGGARFAGHGAGSDIVNGRLAVQDDFKNLDPFLEGVRTVVMVTCLGAGTGGGATPEILKYLHERGINTLCFATLPFEFEGSSRRELSLRGLSLIEDNADTLITIPLDDLYTQSGSDNLKEANQQAVEMLGSVISLLWRMLCMPGYIQIDTERLRSLVVSGTKARLGFAASDDLLDRAHLVVKQLADSKLLKTPGGKPAKAEALLLGIMAGDDLLLSEISVMMKGITGLFDKCSRIEMGTVQDPFFDGRIEIVVFAFENGSKPSSESFASAVPSLDQPPVADVLPVSQNLSKGRGKGKGSKLSFGPTGRGKFQNSEPTIYEGVDLDVPAYIRYGINIEK